MTPQIAITVELVFNEEDIDLNIKTEGSGLDEVKHKAIAVFFKDAISAQAELAAGQAVKYGEVVDALFTTFEQLDN